MKDPRIPFQSVWGNPGNRDQRFTRLMRALSWQLVKRVGGRPKIIRLPTRALFKAYPDCVVSSALVYADWPEFHELMFIRKMIRPGEAVIDLGANVGHILLSLSDLVPPSRLFAFEPTPVSFARLKENWLLNGWPTGNLYPMGIGECEATCYIEDTKAPSTTNSLRSEAAAHGVAVKVMPLDSLLHLWRGLPIGLLKIDVEGFETAVFRGAAGFLKVCSPRLVMFESLSGKLEPEIGDSLGKAGYTVFQLDRHGSPEFGRTDAQNLFAAQLSTLSSIGA